MAECLERSLASIEKSALSDELKFYLMVSLLWPICLVGPYLHPCDTITTDLPLVNESWPDSSFDGAKYGA